MGKHGKPHLQHRFSKENHFLSGLFDDEVLYLVPIIVRSTSPKVHLVNRVFFVTCRSSRRFMSYVGDEVIYSRWMIRWCIQI